MNIKQRAQELLTCDELRGRVPEEVRQFLRDVVALEPVGYVASLHLVRMPAEVMTLIIDRPRTNVPVTAIYTLGAPNDPA